MAEVEVAVVKAMLESTARRSGGAVVKRIDKLTKAQTDAMPAWRDKWIKIGLSTEPADRPRFERAVAECYRAAKLVPPKTIVWVSSPIVMAFAAPIAAAIIERAKKQKPGAVRGAVDGAVRDAVGDAVGVAVGDADGGAVGGAVDVAVDGAVRVAVRDAVGGAVGGAVDVAVGDAVGVAVDGAVRDAVDVAVDVAVGGWRKQVSDHWSKYIGGQFWCGWYWGAAYTTFFTEVCKLSLPVEILAAAAANSEQTQSAGWWWPHTDFVMVCERPRTLKRDDQGRPHSETGQAIEWQDGWGLTMWHGVRIPSDWLVKKPDAKTALTWPNIEQRRCAAEIVGWAVIMDELKPRVIDTDDPEIGELLDVDLPDAPGSRFLRVRCGTGRSFALPVPVEMKTALEANAWTYDVPEVVIKTREVRT